MTEALLRHAVTSSRCWDLRGPCHFSTYSLRLQIPRYDAAAVYHMLDDAGRDLQMRSDNSCFVGRGEDSQTSFTGTTCSLLCSSIYWPPFSCSSKTGLEGPCCSRETIGLLFFKWIFRFGGNMQERKTSQHVIRRTAGTCLGLLVCAGF